jgi:hypothetical protein
MNFHDTRDMYEAIAKWVESQDVEIDWTTLMNCSWWVGPKDWVPPPKWSMPPPFPRQLSTLLVTKLIFAQESEGLQIPPMLTNPAEIELGARGAGGIDLGLAAVEPTGPTQWEKFLGHLASMVIQKVSLYVISEEDRRGLVRMAALEEELERRRVMGNRERVNRQNRGEAVSYMSRKAVATLVERAKKGSMEAIGELARRGWDAEEIAEWRWKARRKAEKGRVAVLKRWRGKAASNGDGVRVVAWSEEEEEEEGMSKVAKAEGGAKKEEVKSGLGIERELEVIRVGPNPRVLTCRYRELASERYCLVVVKSIKNFVKGMKIVMREPLNEEEYRSGWKYEGALPKFKGRW